MSVSPGPSATAMRARAPIVCRSAEFAASSPDVLGQLRCIQRTEITGLAMDDAFLDAVDARRDAGNAGGHCLQQDIGRALAIGGEQENVGSRDQFARVGHRADEAHGLLKPRSGALGLKRSETAKVLSSDDGLNRDFPPDFGNDIDEAGKVLLRRQPPDARYENGVGAYPEPGSPIIAPGGELVLRKNRDDIRDESDGLRTADTAFKLSFRLARVAHHRVDAGKAHPGPQPAHPLGKVGEQRISERADPMHAAAQKREAIAIGVGRPGEEALSVTRDAGAPELQHLRQRIAFEQDDRNSELADPRLPVSQHPGYVDHG